MAGRFLFHQNNSSPPHKLVPQANSFAASPFQASQVAGDNFSPGAEVLALGLTSVLLRETFYTAPVASSEASCRLSVPRGLGDLGAAVLD